jgi:hypothetical protein
MKQFLHLHLRVLVISLVLLLSGKVAYLQNVGINSADPKARLQVGGSFMVSSVYKGTLAEPTPANQLNMINSQTIQFENDSVARFFDPGGPSGNYLPNMTANARCSTWTGNYSNAFLEITIESLQLGTGDSLKISEMAGGIFYRVGNTSITTPLVINSSTPQVTFTFQSNADASVGQGFSIKVRMIYLDKSPEINNYLSGYGMAYHATDQSIRLGTLDQKPRGTKSIMLGEYATASGNNAVSIGSFGTASGNSSIVLGYNAAATTSEATALGAYSRAEGSRATAIGVSTYANGSESVALTGGTADGNRSIAAGISSYAEGENSLAIGYAVRAKAYNSIALGRYNLTSATESPDSWVGTDPLFVIGNGTGSARSNAILIRKDGRIGIGTNLPSADLHITQGSGGGLMLENGADGNKWRIYSASGDNNLTFYNNSNTEIADIDDVTGTFSAISDARLKKDVQPLNNILPVLMQLVPASYHFNWQDSSEEKQVGMLAQEAHKLFPQLVSYDKEKDLYKINYAGFSTIAIRAIQEQQSEIEILKKRLAAIEAKLGQ